MCFIVMEPITDTRKYAPNFQRLTAGPVGSVGDVNLNVRLKHSMPDLPIRYDAVFSGPQEVYYGSNVADGYHESFTSGGIGDAPVYNGNWGGHRDFKIANGWKYQDLRAPDTLHEPILGVMPNYSYNNKIATVFEARRTGFNFLPVPGEYQIAQGQIPRGNAVPGPVETVAEPGVLEAMNGQSVVTNPQAGGLFPMPSATRAGISALGRQQMQKTV